MSEKTQMQMCGVPIPGLRTNHRFATYERFPVPNLLREFDGTFSWADFNGQSSQSSKSSQSSQSVFDTFRTNKELWNLVDSPTSCYVSIDPPDNKGRVAFYRDQQDCVLWFIDSTSGKVYSTADADSVANTVEEFMYRQVVESALWHHMAFDHKLFDGKTNNCSRKCLEAKGIKAEIIDEMVNYLDFYKNF